MRFHLHARRYGAIAGLTLATSLSCLMPPAATANPTPIKLIVGSPPGGTTDTLARLIADDMGKFLKRTVIVENKPGAGGNIAATYIARSEPTGDTLYMAFTSHTINATLFKDLPYHPIKDFTPITLVATVPSVLIANKKVPVNTIAELLDYAKKHPGKLNFALGGIGSSVHMAGEKLKATTGVDIVNIPYKGTNPALADTLGGQVELMFASTTTVLPVIGTGAVKALGVTSLAPIAQFPGVPPIADTIKGFESEAWFGLFGPAGIPAETTKRLYDAAKSAIEEPAFQARLAADGARSNPMTPEQFTQFLTKDVTEWAEVVKAAGTTLE